MNNINEFINSVRTSRKRTGVLYCSGSFTPIIKQFQDELPELKTFDCTSLYKESLTFSASDLLNQIEYNAKSAPTIIFNIETFIVCNSPNYSDQLAKLLTVREPLRPLFFIFYSKKIYRHFSDQFEARILNQQNTIEL